MAKILITKNNNKYSNNYKDIFYFYSKRERDKYVNDYLLDGKNFYNELRKQKNVTVVWNSPNKITINILGDFKLLEKNYLILEHNHKISFWFIINIKYLLNGKIFQLNLEKDIFMSNPELISKLKNFNLIEGHSNPKNYLGIEYDLGKKISYNFRTIPRTQMSPTYKTLTETSWLIVLEKNINNELGLTKIMNYEVYNEPYKLYIAPLNKIPIKESEESSSYVLWASPSGEDSTVENADSSWKDVNLSMPFTDMREKDKLSFLMGEDEYKDSNNYIENISSINPTWLPTEEGSIKLFFLKGSASSNIPEGGDNSLFPSPSNKEDHYYAGYNLLNTYLYDRDSLETETISKIENNKIEIYHFDHQYNKYGSDVTPIEIQYLSDSSFQWRLAKSLNLNQYGSWNLSYSDKKREESYSSAEESDYYPKIGKNDYSKLKYSLKQVAIISEDKWSNSDLVKYYTATTNDRIIGAWVTNFCPLTTSQNDNDINIDISKINNLIKKDDESKIYELKTINYDLLKTLELNTYKIILPEFFQNKHNYDKELIQIAGLMRYQITIENFLNYEIEPLYIKNGLFKFHHYASFTPEWEERIKPVYGLEFTNSNNMFSNEKQFTKANDLFDAYKSNNPVTSKLSWFKGSLAPVTGFMTKGPVGAIQGTTKFFGSTFGNISKRQNMKKTPDELVSSGDAIGDYIFNYNQTRFTLITNYWPGNERDQVLKTIDRKGINYEIAPWIKSYQHIIRANRYNYLKLASLDESLEDLNGLSLEELKVIRDVFENGVTIWNNYRNYKHYDPRGTNLKTIISEKLNSESNLD